MVTLGDAGAAILDAATGTSRRVASPQVEVVDTTGCGDAFAGALISRLAAGDELLAAVETAVRVGAYAATGKGAQPSYPTSQQLAAWSPDRSAADAGSPGARTAAQVCGETSSASSCFACLAASSLAEEA